MAKDVTDRPFTTVSGVPIERLYTPKKPFAISITKRISATPVSRRTREASIPRCIGAGCGRCASSAASARAADTNERFHYLLKTRPDRPLRCLPPPDPDGLRLGSSDVGRRSRQMRRCHRFACRYGGAVRRHSARSDQHVDDDERAGNDSVVDVSRRRGEARCGLEEAARHDSERHPEGIHRAEDIYLSAETFDEADRRYVRVRQRNTSRNGTRSRSAVTTFAKPVRRRFRNWHLLCTTASNTSNGLGGAASTSMISPRGSLSSSTRTTICLKKSPNTARRARSGTKS